jgi:pimeloyl-ACP methyl ester carboxylesterase
MTTLRRAIRSLGYFVHPWRLGENVGPTERIVDGMSERLRAVHDRTGERASVIGVSLGGLYGRWLARSHPELVRQVITLGSPLQLDHADRTSATALVDEVKATWDSRVWPITVRERERGPLPVPSTAVYTQTDGVIRWPGTIDVADELHENVRVRGSHVGLASSVSAMIAIADRLAQPAGEWRRFRPPPALGALFPPASDGALAC